MPWNKTLSVIAALAAAGSIATASAQDLKTKGKELLGSVPQVQDFDPTRFKPDFDGGATIWISPMMLNAPGTIGGEPYTINGKRYIHDFGFSIVNANGRRTANANIICFDAGGRHVPRYNQTFTIAALGAANWAAASVTPPASTDGATRDRDEIWCAINADTSVFAFGWSELRFGSDEKRTNFSLEPATAAGN